RTVSRANACGRSAAATQVRLRPTTHPPIARSTGAWRSCSSRGPEARMKKVLGFFLNPWLLAVLGLLALSLVIWFVGPQGSFFGAVPRASELARWILIALVSLLYIASKLWGLWRARKTNQQVVAALAAQGAPAVATESAEAKQLRERFETALQTLRKMRF